MARPLQSSPFLKFGLFFVFQQRLSCFIFLFLLLLSVCEQDSSSSTHSAVRGRQGTLPFLSGKQEGAGNDWEHYRKKGEKIACTPRLLSSSPQKSPLGEPISLALLDCLLLQRASPVLSGCWKKKTKLSWERPVFTAETRKYAFQLEAHTAQIVTLLKQLPALLSNQSLPSYLEETTGDLSPTILCVLRRGKLPPTWNKECHKIK